MNEGILITIMGIITFFDFMIIKWKLEHKRYADAIVDAGFVFLVLNFFHGSITLVLVGMIAQFIMSIYLLIFPPKFDFLEDI